MKNLQKKKEKRKSCKKKKKNEEFAKKKEKVAKKKEKFVKELKSCKKKRKTKKFTKKLKILNMDNNNVNFLDQLWLFARQLWYDKFNYGILARFDSPYLVPKKRS